VIIAKDQDGVKGLGGGNTEDCLRRDREDDMSGYRVRAGARDGQDGPVHPHRTVAEQRAPPRPAGTPASGN